jgi:hypothetical protein
MVNINAKKYNIEPNKEYGPYITIEEVEKIRKKCTERLWRVRHKITEKERVMRPSYLIIVQNRYLDSLNSNNYQKGLKKYLFNDCIRGSEKRNHNFNLNFEDFIKIITQNCHYCGEPPSEPTRKILISRGHVNEPPFNYNGIDRIDSKIGYNQDNCVPCCSSCNYMKHTATQDEFLNQIGKIYKHLNLSKIQMAEFDDLDTKVQPKELLGADSYDDEENLKRTVAIGKGDDGKIYVTDANLGQS